jgi:predicted GH43/DUF377 family glycosyl hydrolase
MKIKIKKVEKPIIEKGIEHFKFFDWDSLWVYHPCVVEHNKEFYLIYTGKSIKRGVSHKIGIAVSKDLNSWQKLDSNPLLNEGKDGEWDNDFVAHAYVFKDKDKFYMLYDGSKKGDWLESIGLAESKNLTDWKKYSGNPIFKVAANWWENHHVSRCCVFKENGVYYLYYAGHDGERERIGAARGESLLRLKRCFGRPILDIGKEGEWDEKSVSDPRVIKYNQTYLMFYSGIDNRGVERMGLAISNDLLSWKKYKKNPILDVSAQSWDKIAAARADIRIFRNRFYIFYSGKKNFFYNIGIAYLEIEK